MPTILLVEDDDGIRFAIATVLELSGYRVIEASEGQQALNILASGTNIDLIITDNKMDGIDGIEFIRQFRLIGYDIEIIMLTANHSLKCDADYILKKPIDGACFLAAIEFSLLKRKTA